MSDRTMSGRIRLVSPVFLWISAFVVFAIATMVLVAHRGRVDKAHVVLVYLLLVLAGSAWGGRLLGVVLSLAAFLTFDWAFLPPYGTLTVRDPLDWLVLVTFLITSLVAAQLLYKARAERAAVEHAEALREVDRLKDALLVSVSHDLRTPLTTIKGLARELRDVGGETSAVYERALLIEEQADHLNRLVTDLLDVAKLDAGALPLDIQVNTADDLLGALVNQFMGRADRHRLTVRVSSGEILMGRFDFVQTIRILTNLVENAMKYAPVDTPVDVHAFARGERLVFEVLDRGPGVPTELLGRLFEPFSRAERARPDSGSAGLGLSIAKRLVEAQGGEIRYTPRAEGGACFTFDFPLVPMM